MFCSFCIWNPTRKLGGHHSPSHRGVDDADGPQRGGRGIGTSAPPSLCAARPRYQVLRGLPEDPGNRRCEVPATACAQPESERLRGALGALGEERMSFAFHSVWGRLVAPSLEKLLRALSL